MKKLKGLTKSNVLTILLVGYVMAYLIANIVPQVVENFRVKNQYEQDLYQSYQSYR